MVKFLQIITILCCLFGSVLGVGLLFVQAGRDTERRFRHPYDD